MAEETKYKVLGEGTFGAVVQPALPNGEIEYPTNVTKIFTSESDYMDAIKKAKNAKNIGPLAIKAEPYRQKYKVANLDPSIRNTIRTRLKNEYIKLFPNRFEDLRQEWIAKATEYALQNIRLSQTEKQKRYENKYYELQNAYLNSHVPLSTSIYPLRLDFLGEAFSNIASQRKNYEELRGIDYKVLIHQILKSFNVVKAIYDAGYIHGDIRDTNVLCMLDSGLDIPQGTITIVDFDWLLKFDEFYNKYPHFFVAHPPEALLVWQYIYPKDYFDRLREWHKSYYQISDLYSGTNDSDKYLKLLIDPEFETKSDDEMKTLIKKALTLIKDNYNLSYDLFDIDSASNGIFSLIKEAREISPLLPERRQFVFDKMKKYIDSYGLGRALYDSFWKAWYINFITYENYKLVIKYDSTKKIGGISTKDDFDKFIKIRNKLWEIFSGLFASNISDRLDITDAIKQLTDALKTNGLLELDVTPNETAMELERLAILARAWNSDPFASKVLGNIAVTENQKNGSLPTAGGRRRSARLIKKGGTRKIKKRRGRKTLRRR